MKRLDLSQELTVFVSTVGYPTFERCLQHLREQDCTFRQQILDHVAPMSAALQRMMDDCTTPYFVQVDEDMLLYPRAIQTLYRRLSTSADNVAQYVCALYDVHLEKVIYGLKVFRHDIVRGYPYRDVEGCEWDQILRFRADGYTDIRVPLEGLARDSDATLGLHGTFWRPREAYIRFNTLERTRRKGNRTHDWVTRSAGRMLERFLRDPNDVDFYALMGILAAGLSENVTAGQEKDFRLYDQTPGYEQLRQFVQEVRTGWTTGDRLRPGDCEVDIIVEQ